MTALLEVENITHRYRRGAEPALRDVTLGVTAGRNLAVVGESGSGKTTLSRVMLGLLTPSQGAVRYRGAELPLGREAGRGLRRAVQLVLQDPYSSLNPHMRIGQIIDEPLRLLTSDSATARRQRIAELLQAVDLDPELSRRWPHELSGGQRQRVAIARALGPRPEVIVADEPLSALDVSVRLQILTLLRRLSADEDLTLVVISHDLGVVQKLCVDVAVMSQGQIVEAGATERILAQPEHPYTQALLQSVPALPPRPPGVGAEPIKVPHREDSPL